MNNELYHHGILGQKWGVRRYQNKDGTLTAAGRKRLSSGKRFYDSDKYQKQATEEYNNKVESSLRKANKGKEFTGDGTEMIEIIGEKKHAEMYNTYLDKLASAKIKDLGLKESKEAKEYVDSLFDDNRLRKYEITDGNGNKSTWYLDKNTVNDKDFKERYRGYKFKDTYEINKKLDNAKKNGRYDMLFMEIVQNDDAFEKGGTKLLREYKKYLEDGPEEYWKNYIPTQIRGTKYEANYKK